MSPYLYVAGKLFCVNFFTIICLKVKGTLNPEIIYLLNNVYTEHLVFPDILGYTYARVQGMFVCPLNCINYAVRPFLFLITLSVWEVSY